MRTLYTLVGMLGCLAGLVPPAVGFVSKISPFGGPIPCHQMRLAVHAFARGSASGGSVATILEREHLTPLGQSWSGADTTDNSNLVTLMNGITHADPVVQALRKVELSSWLEGLCAAAELGYDEVDTPNEFRTLLGIATQ